MDRTTILRKEIILLITLVFTFVHVTHGNSNSDAFFPSSSSHAFPAQQEMPSYGVKSRNGDGRDWLRTTTRILGQVLNSDIVITTVRWAMAFHLCLALIGEFGQAIEDATAGDAHSDFLSPSSAFPFRNIAVTFDKVDNDDDNDDDMSGNSRDSKKSSYPENKKVDTVADFSRNSKATRECEQLAYVVAQKLRDAGVPTHQELEEEYGDNQEEESVEIQSTSNCHRVKSVEEIVKNLTRTETALLMASMYTPESDDASGIALSSTPMSEIGGLEDVKESLSEVIYAMSNPHFMLTSAYGSLLNAPKGVLLYGPPGCGKTMLAKALSREVGARFLCIAPSNLLRKYVGETNQMVKALFSLARKLQPCVIFIDEMDAIFRERSSNSSDEHDVTRDLKTEFMQLWDGLSSSAYDRLLVMGATNRPFDIDSAFRRRLSKSFYVGLPDADERVEVLNTILKGIPLNSNFDVRKIAECTEGYSPSDMKELLRTAALIPLKEARRENRENQKFFKKQDFPSLRSLTTEDVLKSLTNSRATRFSKAYRQALEDYTREDEQQYDMYSPLLESTDNSIDSASDVHNNEPGAGAAGNFQKPFFENDSLDTSYDFSDDDDFSSSDGNL